MEPRLNQCHAAALRRSGGGYKAATYDHLGLLPNVGLYTAMFFPMQDCFTWDLASSCSGSAPATAQCGVATMLMMLYGT